jgi:hypothetical protein
MNTIDSSSLLLAAYPARLRRRHGAELITTMAEVAGPAGPTRADRWHLALDGLRERFRLPPGRLLAVLAAVLALLAGGAIGAAAGSWAGMWTYPKVPAPVPVASQAIGSDATLDAHPIRQERLWSSTLGRLSPGVDATEAAGRARDRLTAAGWKTTPIDVSGGTDGFHYRRAAFDAKKSGVRLEVTAYYSDDRLVEFDSWSLRPPTYVPFVIGGLVLGLLAGWLAAAALTYRIAGARRRRTSAVTAGAGLALLLLPTVSIYIYLIQYLPNRESYGLNEFVHRALASGPIRSLTDSPNIGPIGLDSPWLNKALVIAGLVAVAAAAIIARPGRGSQEPVQPVDPQIA